MAGGFDLKELSIVGKGRSMLTTKSSAFTMPRSASSSWGKRGAFWGGTLGSVFLRRISDTANHRPRDCVKFTCFHSDFSSRALDGYRRIQRALGAALFSIGVARSTVLEYEAPEG